MSGMIEVAIFSFLISFITTFCLVPPFAYLATKLHFVDMPDGILKKHSSSVPYLGGLAIYCGFIFAVILMIPWNTQVAYLLVGVTVLVVVGFIDDLFVLNPHQKFFGHIIAVVCYIKAGFYGKAIFPYHFLNLAVSFFWMLSIINAFNLVDVMDGLATILAICTTISFIAIAFLFENYFLLTILGSLLGAFLAFFWYNRPPASIYLGDTGSLFIGGILSSITFLFDWSSHRTYGYVIPIIILAIPSLEITTLIFIRTYKGIPFYNGSPDHFSIFLQQKGWDKNKILGYVLFLSILLLVASLLFLSNFLSLRDLVCLGAVFIFIWFYRLII